MSNADSELPGRGTRPSVAVQTYLHDFEPTFHVYIPRESHLLGLLNFAALWHEHLYINDTALGDNPHLLNGYWGRRDRGLFFALREYIRAGVVRCLLRSRVAIGDRVQGP